MYASACNLVEQQLGKGLKPLLLLIVIFIFIMIIINN